MTGTENGAAPGRGAERGPAGVGHLLVRVLPLVFAALGLWICWYSTQLLYFTEFGPGPGFFPMWLGGVLTVLSIWVFATTLRAGRVPMLDDFVPAFGPGMQMAITLVMVGVFALLVERLGFSITMFVVLIVLLPTYGVRIWPTSLVVALGASFGGAWIFIHLLNVYLPPAPGRILSVLGL